jgi:coenzyme F420-0:L-glutamate ligase/coenzyme F420-1:gamma-L-glutamate ligase
MITCIPVVGVGEVQAGDDLAGLVTHAADLRDGDVLVVTSKVVSKSESRVVTLGRDEALAAETDRVVARRGDTSIVRTHHGLVMAAAGIDASNTDPGTLVLLPRDPDASARAIRDRLAVDPGVNVAVVVSDTSGRAWRNGQTDIAVGAAGIEVLDDHAGRTDAYGNPLAVTAPAVADEIAGAAELVAGKLSRTPAAVLRGLGHLVLPPGGHGPGARALVRPESHDMFGHGAREAVGHALRRTGERGFGAPATAGDVAAAVAEVLPDEAVVEVTSGAAIDCVLPDLADERTLGALEERASAVAFAHGWFRTTADADVPAPPGGLRFTPATP